MKKKLLIGVLSLLIFAFLAFYFWPETRYQAYQVSADYQAQVDDYDVPPMPDGWAWNSFTVSDGTKLRWGQTNNQDGVKGTIIWVPGYTAHLNMYGEHFGMLEARGYHVIGVDLRGQGGSDRHREHQPEKLWVDDFQVYSDDLTEFIQSLDLTGDRAVILNGISFGGHVVTRAVIEHDLPIDGLYLMAPAFRPNSGEYTFEQAKSLMNWGRRLGKAEHYVLGQDNWKPDGLDYTVGSDCSSNPGRLYYRDALFTRYPELRVGGITNQYGAEFFASSDLILEDGYLSQLDIPVTLISAEVDTFVVTEVNSQACSSLIPDCREVSIPSTGHCLPQEEDAVLEQMWDEFDRLLDQRLTSKP